MRTSIGFVSQLSAALLVTAFSGFAQQQPPQFGSDVGPYQNAGPDQSQGQSQAANQDQGIPPTQVDPEDRNHGVARVSLLNGEVSVRRGDSGDTVAASINAPLLAQDSILTGQASRAELQFDTVNRVRFGYDTEARISQLTADHFQIQIARGTVTWAMLGDGSAQAEIDTPSVAIRPLGRGDYRIAVLPDGTSQITVRQGTLNVYTPRGVEHIQQGQTMLARGPVDNPEFQTSQAGARDEWDIFNEKRDRELLSSRSYNYVSRDIAGAEELDNYGQWNSDPTYGQVWTPRVAADWAPYRLGRWGYEDYYGWTWISSDPWGWAPYHYGSWFQGSLGWSWCPGPRYGNYFYRPALVAFVGFGGGGGFGFGFGNVGWVPLAPFERFHPWYGRGYGGGYGGFGGGYGFRGRGIYNNVNITNIYRNARATNGVTAINSRDFASGNFGRYSSPSGSQLQQAGLVRGQVPFTPTNNHLRFNDRQSTVQPRTNFGQTQFAAHMQPAASFGRGSSIAQNGTGYNAQRQGFSGSQSPAGTSNWNRFGSPASGQQRSPQQNGSFGRQNYAPQTAPQSNPSRSFQQNGNSSGWQRFGAPGTSGQPNVYSPSGSAGNNRQFNSAQAQGFGRNGSQSVQVAPPLVQQRGFSSQPAYNQPAARQPAYSQPAPRQPAYSQPTYSQPAYQQPRYSQAPSYNRSQPSPSYNRPSFSQQPSPSYNRQSSSAPSSSHQQSFSQPHSENRSSSSGGHDSGSHSRR